MRVVKDIRRAVKQYPSCGETRVATTDDHYFLFVEVLDTLDCFHVSFLLQNIVGQEDIFGSIFEEREPRVEVGVVCVSDASVVTKNRHKYIQSMHSTSCLTYTSNKNTEVVGTVLFSNTRLISYGFRFFEQH